MTKKRDRCLESATADLKEKLTKKAKIAKSASDLPEEQPTPAKEPILLATPYGHRRGTKRGLKLFADHGVLEFYSAIVIWNNVIYLLKFYEYEEAKPYLQALNADELRRLRESWTVNKEHPMTVFTMLDYACDIYTLNI